MIDLNNFTTIKKLDTANVLGSIEQLGEQCQQAWDEVSHISFPNQYNKVTSIVFSGMGGSALGAYVVKSLFSDQLKVPFEIVNDYHLPAYVNEKTLVVLGSYSGTTEETLSCATEAISKKTCVTGLTTGGTLAEILKDVNAPFYLINPKYNPSKQPRLGTGYSVFGQIAILHTLGLLKVELNEATEVVATLKRGNSLYGISTPTKQNRAKKLALSWSQKIPIIVSAEFLTQIGRVIRNQIHESAKSFAAYHDIPELNHHLMEGLSHPKSNKEILQFLFLFSSLYSEPIKKRMKITQDVVVKNGIKIDEFAPTSQGKISQAFECIQFSAYVNYYMALNYEVDPSKIPWVDYFKEQLKKSHS